ARAVGASVLDGCDRERGAHALPTETGAHREAHDRPDPVAGRVFLTPCPRPARTREAHVVRAGLDGAPPHRFVAEEGDDAARRGGVRVRCPNTVYSCSPITTFPGSARSSAIIVSDMTSSCQLPPTAVRRATAA